MKNVHFHSMITIQISWVTVWLFLPEKIWFIWFNHILRLSEFSQGCVVVMHISWWNNQQSCVKSCSLESLAQFCKCSCCRFCHTHSPLFVSTGRGQQRRRCSSRIGDQRRCQRFRQRGWPLGGGGPPGWRRWRRQEWLRCRGSSSRRQRWRLSGQAQDEWIRRGGGVTGQTRSHR